MIRELHPPPPTVIDLEPAGGRPPPAAANATVGAKRIAAVMGALLAAVLIGGTVAGRPPEGQPRHRLAFDEPSPPVTDALAGAGESAAGVGGAEPVRPPDRIPDGWSWRPVGPLPGRQGNVAVWTGREVVYWGGDRPGRRPHGAAYDPKADRWRRLSRSPLTNRTDAAAVWTGREVVVFGGVNGSGPQRDGAAYDPAADRWRMIAESPLSGRVPLAVAWTGSEVLVVGIRGTRLADGIRDAAAYDPARDAWRPLPELPLPVNHGAATWTGSELVLYGMFIDRSRGLLGADGRVARGTALDPVAGRWRELPTAPLSGQGVALAWNGSEVIGWDHDRESAAYDPGTNTWRGLPDLPLEGRDCLPRGVAAGSSVVATHCGQAAIFDRRRGEWEAVEVPAAAVDPPVWVGDGLVHWLAPSGRPDDGTWFRPMGPPPGASS